LTGLSGWVLPVVSSSRLSLLAVMALLLQGCVAAVIPIAAAGLIARKQLKLPSERLNRAPRKVDVAVLDADKTGAIQVLSTSSLPAPQALAPSPFEPFELYAIEQHKLGLAGERRESAVMAPDSTLREPTVVPCDQRPTAVMVDADLQSGGRLLTGALASLRGEGLKILWVLDEGNIAGIAPSALGQAGFRDGDIVLASQGKSQRKQLVRQLATIDYCIVAIAGRRRGDMDELYDYLKDPKTPVPSDVLWNQGWFLIPATPQLPASAIGKP
jgi:microcompartment protein CcmK/EutM